MPRCHMNILFRGARVVGCGPVKKPTVGLAEDGRFLKELPLPLRQKAGPVSRCCQQKGEYAPRPEI